MNKELDKVTGAVEFVGTKFNGSVKVNGTYYSFAKGFTNPGVKQGDNVTLTLEAWESNGKSGFNVVNVARAATSQKELPAKQTKAPSVKAIDSNMSKEEWASKDRRISRQGCIQIAVQVTSTFNEAVKFADQMLEYVNAE